MAQEYIVVEPKNELGTIRLNKSVFDSIALNVIEEDENVKLVEGNILKSGIETRITENSLKLHLVIKVKHNKNVSDVCANLQNKIFESISYMTDFKPDNITIQVVGFIF